MENLRNRVNVHLVRPHEGKKMRKLTSSPLFDRYTVFSGNRLAGVLMNRTKLELNRPVQIGMSILELSKIVMYKFYYGHLKQMYGPRCDLLYTDTDSLLFKIKTEDMYRNMERHLDLYDTSDYPSCHFLHSQKKKKMLGKMKEECAGRPIGEVVVGSTNFKKAKGTTKQVTKKEITHQDYKNALFDAKTYKHGMSMLRSEGHAVYGLRLNKTALSPFDSKRRITSDGVHTLAYGHKDIN